MSLMSAPGPASSFTAATQSSATISLSWNAPGYDGNQGALQPGTNYYVQYATAATVSWSFSSAQVVISTQGVNPGDYQAYLSTGLFANTTYYYSIWTLDTQGDLSPLSSPTTAVTLAQPVASASAAFLSVYSSSAQVRWGALPDIPFSSSTCEGYELDASTAPDFSGTPVSSVTASVLNSTLTVTGLSPNVVYYFRVGSLNWNGLADDVTVGSTNTLAAPPASIASTFTMVGVTSATVQWGTDGNSASTYYALNLSTAANFTGTVFSSTTYNLSATLSGLNPNATYYAEVQAFNNNGIATSFVALGSTVTQGSEPQAPPAPFAPVYISSLTVSFSNGSPANPAGTIYDVQLSTDPAFSVWTDSFTQNFSAGFAGLSPDTTYYAQVAAENYLGVFSPYQSLSSTATLTVPAQTLAQPYSNLSGSGFTLSWTSGTAATGYNPANGLYEAQASPSAAFASGIVDIVVSTTSANFAGLTSNTVYYTRVRAVNWQNFDSSFTYYGSTQTLQSAVPSLLAGTFLVSNASGTFQSASLYTDTTTPSLRVQVQSSFSPGLSVTDTPDTWAVWHLDEGSGSTGQDASLHNNPVDFTGAYSWTQGVIGSAIACDGGSAYGYSANQVTDPTTFTIGVWFKTTTASGGMILGFGNNQTGASGNYDRHIWMDDSGHLSFGIWTGAAETITSAGTYNDGSWHFAMGTFSSGTQVFYVDGAQVGTLTYGGTPQAYNGYWRLCYDNLNGWAPAPTSDYFQGSVDEVFINNTDALSASQALAYYNLTENQGHELSEPSVDISTQSGSLGSWLRISTAAFNITGANGTTQTQLWSSTLTLSGLSLTQTASPGAATDQVAFIASDLISEINSAQYTILVDTTPPVVPTFSPLSGPTTYSLALSGLSASDALSGLTAAPFDVQASSLPGFGTIAYDSGYISGPNLALPSLYANTTYYARARAEDNAGNVSAFSSAQSLATLARAVPAAQIAADFSSSATVSWTGLPLTPSSTTSEGYELDASTAPDFSGTVVSSVTSSAAQTSLTISGLSTDATYYFRVGSLNWIGTANYLSAGSTSTLASFPMSFVLNSISTSTAVLSWTAGAGANQGYELDASSTAFNGKGATISSATFNAALSTLTLSGLLANTTYTFRVAAYNWDGGTNYSPTLSSVTWSNTAGFISPPFLNVAASSAVVRWAALPKTPQAQTAEGYVLKASTASDFSGFIFSSATTNVSLSTLTITGLGSVTTYYFEVGTLNWNGIADYLLLGSTQTLSSSQTQPPATVTNLAASTQTPSNLLLTWTAPTDPYANPWNGNYAIQYSTSSGVSWSTANAQVLFTTASVTAGSAQSYNLAGLSANTTYYIHLWSSDTVPNWSALSNGATQDVLASGITNIAPVSSSSSLTISWLALPLTPSSSTSEGYLLKASTASNFTGTVFSSQTTNAAVSSLTIYGLSANTTYYYEAGPINWNGAPNYVLGSTATLARLISAINPAFLGVYISSTQARWAALPLTPSSSTSEGYQLDASTAPDFSGAVLSSATANVRDSTLTVSGLSPNLVYYFRAGALNWDKVPNDTSLGSTNTLAALPASIASTFTMVGVSSAAAQWGANGNSASTHYTLNLSTAANFTGTLFSSTTYNLSATLTGMSPNATYYAEVRAFNNYGIATSFVALGSTVTQASEPLASALPFNPVYASSLTVGFQNGSPANPTGTVYDVQLSTDPAFSVWTDSFTKNFNAGFAGLSPDTTYYAQAAARNYLGVLSPYQSLSSTSTLAVPPGTLAQSYSNLSGSGFTLSWTSGTAATGYNPANALYDAEVSTSPAFSGGVDDVFTNATSVNFSGLIYGTVYYTRVRAVNWQGLDSAFTTYGSTTTSSSSLPFFLATTFQVSNALGSFQSASLYTDTTTPSLRVQVQSNSPPGLSVSDTPNTYAVWHMDEGSGASSQDSSLHGNSVNFSGTVAWQPGILGQAVYCDGSSTSGGSSTQVVDPTTFSIGVWFKTASGYSSGGMILGFGNAQTGASGQYDRHIWMDNGGHLEFGVYTGATQTVGTSSTYNDGNWHFAMATLSSAGQFFYVGGVQVGSLANTASQAYNGYWRLCYDNLGGWTPAPTSQYFQGDVDEVFIDTTDALSAQQASAYYNLVENQTHELGEPSVDVSTQSGGAGTWVRLSTDTFNITGLDGTTSAQLWSSTLTLTSLNLVQTASPGAATDQVFYLASDVTSNISTAAYTILVDTTPPAVPAFSMSQTTYSIPVSGLTSSDSPSGLAYFDVQSSTYSNFSSVNQDSNFFASAQTGYVFSSLYANTTYYVRARAEDNATNISGFSPIQALPTLAHAVASAQIAADFASSATLSWSGLPLTPSSTTSEGYEVDASTAPDFSGAISSASTPSASQTSLAAAGLAPDTTYYFRVGSLNWFGAANFTAAGSTSTLASAPAGLALNSISTSAASLSWTNGSGTNQGYELDASSTAFNGKGVVLSSATPDSGDMALSLSGLLANTTYVFHVAALNWIAAKNFSSNLSSSSLALPILPSINSVLSNSISVQWTPLPATPSSATSEGYEVDASSTNFGALAPGGTIYISSVSSYAVGSLSVSGLAFSTTYYLRAGALNWSGVADYLSLPSTSTLAALPALISPSFSMVGVSSATVEWDANGNPPTTLYFTSLSTAPNFTGTLFSSATLNTYADLTGLNPNATYYAEVQAVSNDGAPTAFVSLGSTMTLASEPQAPAVAFTPVYVTSLTVVFSNGSPANPSGTLYDVQLSTDPAFSVWTDSFTQGLSASYTGLAINTSYYAQVAAVNGQGAYSPYAALGSTSTLAVLTGTLTPSYSGLSATGFTLTWASGTAAGGYNPDGTNYEAQAALDSGFTTGVIDEVVPTNSASFSGLVSGTQYYTRVQALNWQDIGSGYVTYGSTITSNSSAPSFLNGTFLISNASGTFQSPTLYTNTLTPNMQIQLQSNFNPGLAVTQTTSHLALWHMDEGSGSNAYDSSGNGYTLGLNGGYSWTSGELGSAVHFDGSSAYAVSPSVSGSGWRTNAANNQFTISMWFNTSLPDGYLCQVANSAGSGAGTYDAEISWYSTGANSGHLTFEVTNSGGTRRYIEAPTSYANSNWHFVSAVLNTSGMYLYVDGNLVVSGTQVTSSSARTYAGPTYLWIGAASTLGATTGGTLRSRFLVGNIDEVLVSTIALTGPQIQAYYNLVEQNHEMGAPSVDVSTQAGNSGTWLRLSTAAFHLTGSNGTTSSQLWSSTISLSGFNFVQSTAPGFGTNQVMFLASSLDSNETTVQYTILVDTTPPAVPSFSSLSNPTTYGLTINGLSGSDDLSGLASAPFDVQSSTDPGFGIINEDPGLIAGPNFTFASLKANTTYYVRGDEEDAAQNISGYFSAQALATLAVLPSTPAASLLNIGYSSATLAWNALPSSPPEAAAEGYELDASTAPDFSGIIFSSITTNIALSTLTVALNANTTYYFRVGSLNVAGTPNYESLGSTVTLTLPIGLNPPSLFNIGTSSIAAQWTPLDTSYSSTTAEEYQLEASSTNFGAQSSGGATYLSVTHNPAVGTLTMPGLWANTTYYFRVASLNWASAPDYTVLDATPTLANQAAPAATTFTGVFVSSVQVQWTGLPLAPSSATAESYELDASTAADFSGLIISTETDDIGQTTLIDKPLSALTTYYFRLGTENWAQVSNYIFLGSTETNVSPDVTPPTAVSDLSASTADAGSLILNWTSPTDPDNNPLNGNYAIEYATYTAGVVWSTSAAQVVFSTLSVARSFPQSFQLSGLNANTTYYIRLWSSDSVPNWSTLSDGATQAVLAQPLSSIVASAISSATLSVSWAQLPTFPSSMTSEGYALNASTSSNFSGIVYSSQTADPLLTSLSLLGLNANTTYYYEAGSLNWNGAADFTLGGSTSTLAPPVQIITPPFLSVTVSTIQTRWAALPSSPPSPSSATAEGYELDASSTDFGASAPGGIVYSSITLNVANSTLSVSGLSNNVTYYFRLGSLNWNGVANYSSLPSTSTLAALPATAFPSFTMVGASSATVQWSANGNSTTTLYNVNLSTASDFSGTLLPANTLNLYATLTGLNPNATYYAEVQAVSNDGAPTAFVSLGSTMTQASTPQVPAVAFTPVNVTSLTVVFSNGSPANPSGTLYDVQLSTDPAFSVWTDSFTQGLSASYTGLSINTSYYAQVAAINGQGAYSPYAALGSTSTLAVLTGTLTPSYSGLSATGFTLTWASGTAAGGYNPDGTDYEAQAALDSGFTTGIIDDVVSTNSVNFTGLTAGTVYYTRVQALNWQDIGSGYVTYGSTQTLNSSIPTFLNGSFLVSNAAGTFQSPTLYTDTTTPALQIQVQSNFAPGLAVAQTTSHLALWHMDEGSGSSAYDASGNGYTLGLNGGYSWASGELGSGVQFDGSSAYAVSPSVSGSGWRTNAANNQFTISMWFNTSLPDGYLCQVANSNAAGAGTYDAEISWYRITEKLAFEVTNTGGTRYYLQATKSYADGNWHFVSAVLNTSGMSLYIDGQSQGTSASVTSASARTYAGPAYLWTGAASTLGTNTGGSLANRFFNGTIDEVLVSTIALTGAQIQAYYNVVEQGHELGSPSVDVSTTGAGGTWTRISTSAFHLTGANGTTAAQTWSSTISLSGFNFIQSTGAGVGTDQVTFLASSLDSNEQTAQYTILVDTTPPAVPSFSSLSNPTTYGLTINGLSGSDDLSGLAAAPFDVQASTDLGFGVINANSGFIAGPSFTFDALYPNTTYYVRAYEQDAAGNNSGYSSAQALATMAVVPSTAAVPFLDVGYSSAAAVWTALPLSPPAASSASAEGYELDVATTPDFSTIFYSSSTTSLSLSTITVANLDFANTYYFRLGTQNWAGAIGYESLGQLAMQVNTSSAGVDLGSFNADLYVSTVAVSSIVVTNAGSIPETFTVWGATGTPGCPWILGTSTGIETVLLQGLWNSAQPSSDSFQTPVTGSTTTSTAVNYAGDESGVDVPAGATRTLWFKFWRPTSTTAVNQPESFHVYIAPIYP